MMHEFELTDDEYRLILDALLYAEDNAVSREAEAGFHNASHELIEQYQSSRNDSRGELDE